MVINSNNTYKGPIDSLESDQILVFGSNTEGRHGKGLALLAAKKYGAIYGQSHGRQGRCYAIITKDISKHSKPVGPGMIMGQILDLFEYARSHSNLKFLFPYMDGTPNLNGYSSKDIADMVKIASRIIPIPENFIMEESFHKLYSSL